MLTVIFGRVTLTKAAKYLMLLVANAETVPKSQIRKELTFRNGPQIHLLPNLI